LNEISIGSSNTGGSAEQCPVLMKERLGSVVLISLALQMPVQQFFEGDLYLGDPPENRPAGLKRPHTRAR
jgi:hypothetical protein